MNNYPLSVFVKNANYGNKFTLDGGGATGYVKYFNAPATGWNVKYYLEPIPLQELLINPNLKQNPGTTAYSVQYSFFISMTYPVQNNRNI